MKTLRPRAWYGVILAAAFAAATIYAALLVAPPRPAHGQANPNYDLYFLLADGILSKTTTSALEQTHLPKATGGTFYGGSINTTAPNMWVFLLDSTTVSAGGAVTGCGDGAHANGCVAKWWQVPAAATFGISGSPPVLLTNGISLACSTTGPFTITLSATCTFSAEVR